MERITERDLETAKQRLLCCINEALECGDLKKMTFYVDDIKESLENLKATAKQVADENKKEAELRTELDRLYLETINISFNV